MSGELSRKDIENVIRLLKTALTYDPEALDTPDDDVLRWEGEGGSPSREPVV